MQDHQTDLVPLAPADLWVRRADSFRIQMIRWIGLFAILAVPFTASAILAVIANIVFVVQILANRGRHTLFLRNLYGLPSLRESGHGPRETPGVTLIVPARNEEDAIEAAARSATALDYPNLAILFVNDHSADSTGAILDTIALESARVRVLHDAPAREGWLGKANAVWHAAQQSDSTKPWLALADADVMFHPLALRSAMACAESQGLDYLTCVVHLANGSLSEEFYMPAPWAALIQSAHHDQLNDPRTAAIGVGAFVLVKRDVYIACGGHAAIRDRQPEDTLLAALIKKHGGKVGVCWTSAMMRVRIYRGHRQLQQFIVRKIRVQNNDSLWRLLNRCVLILIQDALPLPIAAAAIAAQTLHFGFRISLTFVAISALMAYLTNVASMEKVRVIAYMRPALEWFHPIGALMRLQFFARAAAQILAGKRMEWRGRDFTSK
ncbi:MAG: glycosyltransferase [Candidatus Hydrogenedentes bacterium]|nr:glycosyltransferase [Candidatus Hydrogenedentota bacterium]